MKTTLLFSVNTVLMLLLLIMVWKLYVNLPKAVSVHQPGENTEILAHSNNNRLDTMIEENTMLLQPEQQIALRSLLREIVSSEIRNQLAISLSELTQVQSSAGEANAILTDEQSRIYQYSRQILDDVVNGAAWTQDTDLQFESNLAKLPNQQSFELARQQAKLVSQGLIDVPTHIAGAAQ